MPSQMSQRRQIMPSDSDVLSNRGNPRQSLATMRPDILPQAGDRRALTWIPAESTDAHVEGSYAIRHAVRDRLAVAHVSRARPPATASGSATGKLHRARHSRRDLPMPREPDRQPHPPAHRWRATPPPDDPRGSIDHPALARTPRKPSSPPGERPMLSGPCTCDIKPCAPHGSETRLTMPKHGTSTRTTRATRSPLHSHSDGSHRRPHRPHRRKTDTCCHPNACDRRLTEHRRGRTRHTRGRPRFIIGPRITDGHDVSRETPRRHRPSYCSPRYTRSASRTKLAPCTPP